MMSPGILEELKTVGTAIVYGASVTLVYDFLRIFRRVISHGNWWIGVEDFVFWIWTSFWLFSVLYRENDGNLRLYMIGAMILGMLLYHRTISEPLVEISGKILKKVVGMLLRPLKMLKIYIIFLGNKLKKILQDIIIKINYHNR